MSALLSVLNAETPEFQKSIPIPVVAANANAPHKVTRSVPVSILEPPVKAAKAPSNARLNKDMAETAGIREEGAIITMSNGNAAPTENVMADVIAA